MQDSPANTGAMRDLHIQLLGGFAVSVGSFTIAEAQWKSRRARSLVKLLALAPSHRLHRDQVIDTLWPDSDFSAATNNFHQTLYAVRRVLEPAGGISLTLEDGFLNLSGGEGQTLSVDVGLFEAAATRTKINQDPAVYQAALALYPGDLLPEDLYEEWTIQRRVMLRHTYLNLLMDLARLYEARQEYPQGITALQQVLTMDKSHEEAYAGLMRQYALSGQRQQALRQYQTLCEILQTELDAEPSEQTAQLYESIRAGRFSPIMPTAVTRRHNLPAQLTSFIGREKQINEVRLLVSDHRLVTLTGSGGTGKTRLALQVAEKALDLFPDGVWLVELASLSDPDFVPQACFQALDLVHQPGISPTNTLARFFENKRALIILDNCEHMLAACTGLTNALLKGCAHLHFLATSREILSVPGENPYRVPSLTFPDPHDLLILEKITEFEAIQLFFEAMQLFAERAGQVSPGFRLTAENANAIALICQRLDGIPLAIELAAARMHMMTVDHLASRLDNTFRILTGGSKAVLPRQQTLKATIDWSYDLLSPKEHLLLQRLSVFAGGWTLEAAEIVCADAEVIENALGALEVIDLLTNLVDKSLVIAYIQKDGARFHLLETIRQYARDRLMETGHGEDVRRHHLIYFAHLSGEAEPHLRGKGQIEWLERLDQELDNLRAALEWSFSSQIELGLKIAADLMWFWQLRALFIEGFDWLEKLLDVETEQRGKQPLVGERALQRARGLRAFAYQGNYLNSLVEERSAIYQESIAILRTFEPLPRRELGISLFFLLFHQGILYQSSPTREEMLAFLTKVNEKFYLSEYYYFMNWYADDLDQAIDFMNTSLAISHEIEDLDGIASRSSSLGGLLMFKGDYVHAETLIQKGIELSQKIKNYWGEANFLVKLSELSMVQGNYTEAIHIAEAAISKYRALNYLDPINLPFEMLQKIAWSQGNYVRSQQYAQENIASYMNEWSEKSIYLYLGRAAISQGDLTQAEVYLRRAIPPDDWRFVTVYWWSLFTPQVLGWIALFSRQKKYSISARLIGAVDFIYRQIEPNLIPRERSEFAADLASTRAALEEDAFAAAFTEGQAMTLERAITWVAGEMHAVEE